MDLFTLIFVATSFALLLFACFAIGVARIAKGRGGLRENLVFLAAPTGFFLVSVYVVFIETPAPPQALANCVSQEAQPMPKASHSP